MPRRIVLRTSLMAVLVLVLATAVGPRGAATAQSIAHDLSGSWRLQADAQAARNRRPITGLSVATQLVIRQSPAAVNIDSNTGTANTIVTTTYPLDGREHSIPGPIGWETRAVSSWDGTKLTVAIRRSVQGPAGELVFDIRELYTPAAKTLTLERTQGRTVQTLVYERQ